MTIFEKILEFNTKIIGMEKPTGEFRKLDGERFDWFQNVIQEEMEEFAEAWHRCEDPNDELDACCDAIVYLIGRIQEMGITEEQYESMMDQIHNANMQKKLGNKGRGSDTDAVKPEGWKPPAGVL